jgi:hypothetical protein
MRPDNCLITSVSIAETSSFDNWHSDSLVTREGQAPNPTKVQSANGRTYVTVVLSFGSEVYSHH